MSTSSPSSKIPASSPTSVLVPEESLPEALDAFRATELAYPSELAECCESLSRKLPVLVSCEKELVPYFYRALRDRLRTSNLRAQYLDGRPRETDPLGLGFLGRMLYHISEIVRGGTEDNVIVLPHLDLLFGASGGALSSEAREVIAVLYENPNIVWMGFQDVSLTLPSVVESLFPRKLSVLGVPRTRLGQIVTKGESRKFGPPGGLNVFGLYRNVSGVNAARLRRILSGIQGEDYPVNAAPVWAQIRNATMTSDVALPNVDLHKDIGGYSPVKMQLQREIIDLVTAHQKARTAEEATELESILPRGMIFWGPPGTGKCLGKGTPVLKFSGEVTSVEAIQVGDLLMGPDGTPRRVLSTNVGRGPLFRITPNKGDSWVCNDVHILTLVNTDDGCVEDIGLDVFLSKSSHYRERRKLFHVPVDFKTSDPLPLDPYFLGAWFGDGVKSQGKFGFYTVGISKPDKEIASLCHSMAEQYNIGTSVRFGTGGCPTWFIVGPKGGAHNQNKLLECLRGLVGREVRIPQEYLTASRADRQAFLAGFLDTDGSPDHGGVEITQKREDWADGIAFVARSLGFFVTKRIKTVPGYGDYYRLRIDGDFSQIPFRIERKRPVQKPRRTDPLRTGFRADPLGEGDYYGFTLDGDGRFLLGDFTVTHNTMFAKGMATALGATVIVVSGPELKSKWVGEAEQNLRRVFAQARASAPSVIVFDEIDSFATARGTYEGSGVEHSMVNTLLTEMDGFRKNEMVFVVATTNFVESLDSALMRPGRFEFKLHIPYPNADDRREVLSIYNRKMGLGMTPEALEYAVARTGEIVEGGNTPYSGDHIQAFCRALARMRLRKGLRGDGFPSTAQDVEEALTANVERPKLTKEERHTTAVHECGHAIAALYTKGAPPIQRISIRGDLGGALGHVRFGESANRYTVTTEQAFARIVVAFGGRTAERVVLGMCSFGASSDLRAATEMARYMVEIEGVGEFTPGYWRSKQESDATRESIDRAVQKILRDAEEAAVGIIEEHKGELLALVEILLEKEVLDQHNLGVVTSKK